MRHAADPDRVVAVTTILSRQRSVTRAAVASVCVGLVLADRVRVVDGLFAAAPHWTPE